MRIKFSTISKHLSWCICLVVFTSCQNDDQNDPTPLSQEDYATYESNLLGHMRHFGEQIRSSSSLGFDDESLKSISSSYFEGDDHTAFVDAIDNPISEQLSEALQGKVDGLHAAIDDHEAHTGYLSHLNERFDSEFNSAEFDEADKASLLYHIVHLRVVTQFFNEHEDLFSPTFIGGRTANTNWWDDWGKCTVQSKGNAVAGSGSESEAKVTGAVAKNLEDTQSQCNTAIFDTARKYLDGLRQNPIFNSNDSIFNMYSYGYIQDGSIVPDDGTPPVQTLEDYKLPEPIGYTITNPKLMQGPYMGVTAEGKYYALTDCSGFVSFVVANTNPDAYAEIFDNLGTNQGISYLDYCPSASQYANFDPDNSTYWSYVGDKGSPAYESIQPGDIIAWDEPQDRDGDTGHVMIAAGPVQKNADNCFLVEILDSTIDQHLHNDRIGVIRKNTTQDPPTYDPTGVGAGTIGLSIDANGNLWSNFFPSPDDMCNVPDNCDNTGNSHWYCHPNITILRLQSNPN